MGYIDREQALSHPFANGKYDHEHANEHFILGFESYREWLERLPTIDLVRCWECMYWHEGEWYNTCDKHIGHGFMAEHFCSDGERRTDESKYL